MQVVVIVMFHMCWLGPSLPIASRGGRGPAAPPQTLFIPLLSLRTSPAHPSSATNVNPRSFLQLSTSTNFDPLFQSLLRIARCSYTYSRPNIDLRSTTIYSATLASNLSAPTIHTTCYLDNPTLIWSHLLQPHNHGSTQRPMGSFRGGSS
jgi:hypothetical protein